MFARVLIANRGEIALRIRRTLRRLGIESVAVYSEADEGSPHVAAADVAVCIGPAAARDSYLKADRILEAARSCGAEAIHPGYGFLSERPQFAEACEKAGIVFVGPTPAQMRAFGLKHTARELSEREGVPLLPGSGLLADVEHARAEAERIGFPVMMKSAAGGGGIGMQLCRDPGSLATAFASIERLARGNFEDGGIFLERFVEEARHIEVQVFGDGRGAVIALGERDCSLQRRNQKVVEETPAPGISEDLRARLADSAVRLARSVDYRSAGTVEFIADRRSGEFYFLEVNTRLQVEHGVTEAVTGIDLVEWMIRLAAGELPPLEEIAPKRKGAAVEVRLYAEDPGKGFLPSAGTLTRVVFPQGVRCDTWVERGTEVTPFYDPLLAKLIVSGDDREQALERLREGLAASRLDGIETNLEYLRQVAAEPAFLRGEHSTSTLATIHYRPRTIDVLEAGVQTTVQDCPGRLGYWAVGVPPSGPMDPRAFRLANRIVGNDESAAGLECTACGPTLRFNVKATIALAGAEMEATLDGEAIPYWSPIEVEAGAVLRLGSVRGHGARTYLAVRGGLDVPEYLGSRATFTLGLFGGHGGRALKPGDVLRVADAEGAEPAAIPAEAIPTYTSEWEIGVVYGPHGAPDFFTPADVESFFATDWMVHYNSSRTGVRLLGPKPVWARKDGGEAGLHPSNIHDNAYAVGSVDFTGDMPIILGPDGPSLGGFVCPATVVAAELWKLGQLKPGDTVRFKNGDIPHFPTGAKPPTDAVLHRIASTPDRPEVAYRPCGDRALLVEYGPPVLDLRLRFRAHALMRWLEENPLPGVIDLTPGIRSLQVHFDGAKLPLDRVLDELIAAEAELPAITEMEVPTRIVHLPLSWDDPAIRLAVQKYAQGVRPDAPWCPSNIEFIRRINGLETVEQVKETIFSASYLVLGLGDVYLGAPVATPLEPRHRLVTTKYNPARTWTPENAVGIGGAYLCVYGMEGPGGYQLFGRTLQMWNRWRSTADFEPGKPWLLRFFDQIRFFPVSAEELLRQRRAFADGRMRLEIQEETFRLRDYLGFLEANRAEIAAFKARQQAAFEEERARWASAGTDVTTTVVDAGSNGAAAEIPPGCRAVLATVPGNVWKIAVKPGMRVAAGELLVILESMKMEIPVEASAESEVVEIRCAEGRPVASGDALCVLRMAGEEPR